MSNPEVSVILATFNGEKKGFLEKSINSVLKQSYDDYELIIIDDGSTDNTKQLCQKFNNKKIKYYYHKNQGQTLSKNFGFSICKGKYICLIDDDDIWMNDKLEKQVKYYNNNKDKNIGILTTWMELIDINGNFIGYKKKIEEGNVYEKIFYDNMVNVSSVMIKKEAIDKVGFFDPNLPLRQDWDLWIRISKYYEIHQLKEILVKYRIHENNISKNIDLTVKYSELLLKKNLNAAPLSFNKKDILGNFYFEQSENFYANYRMKEFRTYLIKGIFNSVKRFHIRFLYKLLLSIMPLFFLKKIQNIFRMFK